MRRRITLSCLAVFLALSITGRAQVPSLDPVNGVVPAIFNSAGGHSYHLPLYLVMYEWSFGELLLTAALAPADSSVLVTHGVLQPCTDQIGYSPYTVLFEAGDYKLYPNPTRDGKFTVDFFVRTPGQMTLQLINSVGSILQTKSYHYDGCCRTELFDISRYPNGIYFVVADLKPDTNRQDNFQVIRHSGLKVIKMNEK